MRLTAVALFFLSVCNVRAGIPLKWTLDEEIGRKGRAEWELDTPSGVAVSRDERLIVISDQEEDTLVLFDADGYWERTLGLPDDGGNVEYDGPIAPVFDANGRLWVVDRGNHRLVQISTEGILLREVGSKGISSGRFKSPVDLALDKDGNLYVADYGNRRIQVFSGNGKFDSLWRGGHGKGRNRLSRPIALAYSKQGEGHIWVANESSAMLEQFDLEGDWEDTLDLSEIVDGDIVVADIAFYQTYHRMVVLDSAGNRLLVLDGQRRLKVEFALPTDAICTGVVVADGMDLYLVDVAGKRVLVYERR